MTMGSFSNHEGMTAKTTLEDNDVREHNRVARAARNLIGFFDVVRQRIT